MQLPVISGKLFSQIASRRFAFHQAFEEITTMLATFFFRPQPLGFRQVVQQAYWLIHLIDAVTS